MSQFRLSFLQSAFRAAGSAVTQRGEDVVSGRMMPTFAPLPSTAPLADEAESLDDADAEVESELLEPDDDFLSLLPPQAVRVIAAAIPTTASDAVVLRMRCPLGGWAAPRELAVRSP